MQKQELLKLKECRRLDGFEIVQVAKVKITKGAGTNIDPVRPVYSYWDMNGNFLFEVDTCNEQPIKKAYEKSDIIHSYVDFL